MNEGNVISLDVWRTKKSAEERIEKEEVGPACPKCDGLMLPGVDSFQQVWVCTVCAIILWTQ